MMTPFRVKAQLSPGEKIAVKAKHVALCLLLSTLSACSFNRTQSGSILVVAVEGLSFDLVSCESDSLASHDMEGFRILCDESVRFSHAYTTSTLSEAALTSLLTGLYPAEHHVRHNGNDHLSPKIHSVAEAAAERGYRTAFISGGPPILRKSGLSQGFEIFDDNVSPQEMYRPARETIQAYLKWLKEDALPDRSLAMLYFSDLQFPERKTKTDLGEFRDRSPEAQLHEIGESLAFLFNELKRLNLWNSMRVMVVGLNGSLNYHPQEIQPLNLFSENTQVSLFIKPDGKARDLGLQWSIDKNISLTDVGHTLFDWLDAPAPEPIIQRLPRVSLTGVLGKPEVNWDEDRLILIESAWGAWREISPMRYSVRFKQYLYIHDQKPQMFNTLIDRLESNPLSVEDPLWINLSADILGFFKEQEWPKWEIKEPDWIQRVNLAYEFWKDEGASAPAFQFQLDRSAVPDTQMRNWLIGAALARRDSRALIELGEQYKNWAAVYVGRRLQNERLRAQGFPCAALFRVLRKPLQGESLRRACKDPMLLRLYEWANGSDEDIRVRSREAFIKMYSAREQETELGRLNYLRFLTWDAPLQFPQLATLSDLYLALPRNSNLEEQVRNRTLGKDSGLDL